MAYKTTGKFKPCKGCKTPMTCSKFGCQKQGE